MTECTQKTVHKGTVRIAALFTLTVLLGLFCCEMANWHTPDQDDFKVYLTAAKLVREHKGSEIYNGADTGINPQLRTARPDSVFQRAATELGIQDVRLYVYPPTLADMLIPFTFLSLRHACDLWLAFNVVALFSSAMLVGWMLYGSAFRFPTLAIFIVILCFRANIVTLSQGQISSVLLLLWTGGIVFYTKGFWRISAVALALAAVIKLTPLLAVLPFLIWREWKWCRAYLFSLAVICAALIAINGPHTIVVFVAHVMTPMSAAFPANANISLPSQLPEIYVGLAGAARRIGLARHLLVKGAAVPVVITSGAKLVSLTVILAALLYVREIGTALSTSGRAKVLSFIALLSLYCSPVAWQHAYGITFLVALLLWKEALDDGASRSELFLLVFCTLEFSFVCDRLLAGMTQGALLSSTALIGPISGCILIFCTLRKMLNSQLSVDNGCLDKRELRATP